MRTLRCWSPVGGDRATLGERLELRSVEGLVDAEARRDPLELRGALAEDRSRSVELRGEELVGLGVDRTRRFLAIGPLLDGAEREVARAVGATIGLRAHPLAH